MRNLLTFDEFLNESQLNEALDKEQKEVVKKITDITTKFIEKTLPDMAAKYDCYMRNSNDGSDFADYEIRAKEDTREGMISVNTRTLNRRKNKNIIVLGAGVQTWMNTKADDYKKGAPFQGTELQSFKEGRNEIGRIVYPWLDGAKDRDYENLRDESIIKVYEDWLYKTILKGIEDNLKYFKSKGIMDPMNESQLNENAAQEKKIIKWLDSNPDARPYDGDDDYLYYLKDEAFGEVAIGIEDGIVTVDVEDGNDPEVMSTREFIKSWM